MLLFESRKVVRLPSPFRSPGVIVEIRLLSNSSSVVSEDRFKDDIAVRP